VFLDGVCLPRDHGGLPATRRRWPRCAAGFTWNTTRWGRATGPTRNSTRWSAGRSPPWAASGHRPNS